MGLRDVADDDAADSSSGSQLTEKTVFDRTAISDEGQQRSKSGDDCTAGDDHRECFRYRSDTARIP